MAEVYAAITGAAGLVSLGIEVMKGLVNYYASWKDQNGQVSQLLKTLNSVLNIFHHLKKALKDRSEEEAQQIKESMLDCEEIIQELRFKLGRFEQSPASDGKQRIEIALRRAAYPLQINTLERLETNIADIRDNLRLAIATLNIGDQKAIHDDIRDVSSIIRQMSASHIASDILHWLKAPDATLDHNIISNKHQAGTGQWFIKGDTFQNWLTESHLLWVNGFAGSGKSVICSTAIQRTLRLKWQDPRIGVAFFYIRFSDHAKQTLSAILRAVLFQLSAQLPEAEHDLQQLHSSYLTGTPPTEALKACLQRIIQRFNKVFIFIDALDEIPRFEGRSEVLMTIETMQKWDKLHLFVTSRDLIDIREALNSPATDELRMEITEIDKDIACYVSRHLETSKELNIFKSLHRQIKQALTDRAQGV